MRTCTQTNTCWGFLHTQVPASDYQLTQRHQNYPPQAPPPPAEVKGEDEEEGTARTNALTCEKMMGCSRKERSRDYGAHPSSQSSWSFYSYSKPRFLFPLRKASWEKRQIRRLRWREAVRPAGPKTQRSEIHKNQRTTRRQHDDCVCACLCVYDL